MHIYDCCSECQHFAPWGSTVGYCIKHEVDTNTSDCCQDFISDEDSDNGFRAI